MKNILFIIGTRPEAIKMAPIIRELRMRQGMRVHVCVTSQHREMLQSVLPYFDVTPDIDLDVMNVGQSVNGVLAKILDRLPKVFASKSPDMVLVQGDTATCFAGAVAAFGQGISVGHVEAGLRTHDLGNPFPEEGYRQMVSRIASIHFAPTVSAAKSLRGEGIERNVHITGNTVIDALLYAKEYLISHPEAAHVLALPQDLQMGARPFVLVTGHRRENFGEPFRAICLAIRQLAEIYPMMSFVYPVHLNPRVQQPVRDILSNIPNVYLIEPQPYMPFVGLMQRCQWVLTDSGGIQEEAPSLRKPVLVMRKTTERPESVQAGTSLLVGTDVSSIVAASARIIEDKTLYKTMSTTLSPYGDGTSSRKICDILQEFL